MRNLLLALLIGTSGAQANNCYQPSQDLASNGDNYYDIVVDAKLDSAARNKLKQVYKLLEGDWSGRLTEMLCKGPERDIQVEYRHYQLESTVKSGQHGSLHVQSDRHWTQERRRQQTSRHLFGHDGAYKLLDISENAFTVSHKYRNTTVQGNSIFREAITRLERGSNGQLIFSLSNYINGVLVSTETANMTKK